MTAQSSRQEVPTQHERKDPSKGRVINRSDALQRRREEFAANARPATSTIFDWTTSLSASPVQLKAFDGAITELHDQVSVGNHEVWGDPLPAHLQYRKRDEDTDTKSADAHAIAARGVAGAGGAMPHADVIQKSFGRHDISHVQAHTGGHAAAASQALGAEAYATGSHIAFGATPSLHTAAHEAAHIVQQQAGVSLKGGIGESGDRYERHADEVADAVVQGKSAEGILDRMAGGGGAGSSVQMKALQFEKPPQRDDDEDDDVPSVQELVRLEEERKKAKARQNETSSPTPSQPDDDFDQMVVDRHVQAEQWRQHSEANQAESPADIAENEDPDTDEVARPPVRNAQQEAAVADADAHEEELRKKGSLTPTVTGNSTSVGVTSAASKDGSKVKGNFVHDGTTSSFGTGVSGVKVGENTSVGGSVGVVKQGDAEGYSVGADGEHKGASASVSATVTDGGKVKWDPATNRWTCEYTTNRALGGSGGRKWEQAPIPDEMPKATSSVSASGGVDSKASLRVKRSFASEEEAKAYLAKMESEDESGLSSHDERGAALLGALGEGDELSREDVDGVSAGGSANVGGAVDLGLKVGMSSTDSVKVVRKGDFFEVTVKEMVTEEGGASAGAGFVSMNHGLTRGGGKEKVVKVPATAEGQATIAQILDDQSLDDIDRSAYRLLTETDITSAGDNHGFDVGVMGFSSSNTVTEESQFDANGNPLKHTVNGTNQDSLVGFMNAFHSKESQSLTIITPAPSENCGPDKPMTRYLLSASIDTSDVGSTASAMTQVTGEKAQGYGSDEELNRDYAITGEFDEAQIKAVVAHVLSPDYQAKISSGHFLKMFGGKRIGSDIEKLSDGLKAAGSDKHEQARALAKFVSESGTGGLRYLIETTGEVAEKKGVELSITADEDIVFPGPAKQLRIAQAIEAGWAGLDVSPLDYKLMDRLQQLANEEHSAYLTLVEAKNFTEVPSTLRERRMIEAKKNYAELMKLVGEFKSAPTAGELYENTDHEELTPDDRGAWEVLGKDARNWNTDESTELSPGQFEFGGETVEGGAVVAPAGREWETLSPEQQQAAMHLGFNQDTWDSYDSLTPRDDRAELVAELEHARTLRDEVQGAMAVLRDGGYLNPFSIEDIKLKDGLLARLEEAESTLSRAEGAPFALHWECADATHKAVTAREQLAALKSDLAAAQHTKSREKQDRTEAEWQEKAAYYEEWKARNR